MTLTDIWNWVAHILSVGWNWFVNTNVLIILLCLSGVCVVIFLLFCVRFRLKEQSEKLRMEKSQREFEEGINTATEKIRELVTKLGFVCPECGNTALSDTEIYELAFLEVLHQMLSKEGSDDQDPRARLMGEVCSAVCNSDSFVHDCVECAKIRQKARCNYENASTSSFNWARAKVLKEVKDLNCYCLTNKRNMR